MNRDDIIRMAREAGIFTGGHPMNPWNVYPSDLDRFAALVAAAEREACAKAAENQWETPGTQRRTAERCAAAIRTRGTK